MESNGRALGGFRAEGIRLLGWKDFLLGLGPKKYWCYVGL